MDSEHESLFTKALDRYKAGAEPIDLIEDFEKITKSAPNQSSGWTCLAWLQLLCERPQEALNTAKIAVKLNGQDPQARINLSLALLETQSKGVRDQIDIAKKLLITVPEFEKDLKDSIADGLTRKPDWESLKKIKKWLGF